METLFDLKPTIIPDPFPGKTCRECSNRERWECNSKVIQYCGVIRSNRTQNGLKKIKVTNKACVHFKARK